MAKACGWCIVAALLLVALTIASTANVGRYQLVQRENNLVMMVDTKTGQCWENNPDRSWSKLPDNPTN